MKIIVDRGKCTGLGICESLAPDLFEVTDDGSVEVLSGTVGADQLELVQKAIDGCPTLALRLEA